MCLLLELCSSYTIFEVYLFIKKMTFTIVCDFNKELPNAQKYLVLAFIDQNTFLLDTPILKIEHLILLFFF